MTKSSQTESDHLSESPVSALKEQGITFQIGTFADYHSLDVVVLQCPDKLNVAKIRLLQVQVLDFAFLAIGYPGHVDMNIFQSIPSQPFLNP